MIKKRLSELSCNKDEFDRPKLLYVQTEAKTSRNRNRDIIWFNPSFSRNVKTNIGKTLLKFNYKKQFHKIFNLNIIKLSYSSMSNMSSFIKQHNLNILSSSPNSEEHSCNCRNKDNGPFAGSCLKTWIVFTANVIKQNETHVLYGASDREFKYRYNNHINSFWNQDYENSKLKCKGTEFNLKWSIAMYAAPYRCGTRGCDLCLIEKYIIARANQNNLLNNRNKLISHVSIEISAFKKYMTHFELIYSWFTMKQFKLNVLSVPMAN